MSCKVWEAYAFQKLPEAYNLICSALEADDQDN